MKPAYDTQTMSASIAKDQTFRIDAADIIVLQGKSALDDTFDVSEDGGVTWRSVSARESAIFTSGQPVYVRAVDSGMVVGIERKTLSHFLGDEGERLPIVTATTGPDGGISLLLDGKHETVVYAARQGSAEPLLPVRPTATVVHWYLYDYKAPDAAHPMDQIFRVGAARWLHDAGGHAYSFHAAEAVSGAPLGGQLMRIRSAASDALLRSAGSPPVRHGRINLCGPLSGWTPTFGGVGQPPAVEPATGPSGAPGAVRVSFNCVDAGSSSNRSMFRSVNIPSAEGETLDAKIWIRAAEPGDVGKTIRLSNENTTLFSGRAFVLPADWTLVNRKIIRNDSGVSTNFLLETRGTSTDLEASVLLFSPDLRFSSDGALPPQHLFSSDNYETAGLPIGAQFNGTSTALTSSVCGIDDEVFLCAAMRIHVLNEEQIVVSNADGNTGYTLRVTPSNEVEFSVGTGSERVAVTSRAIGRYERVAIRAWHDGAQIGVRLNTEDAVVAVAGPASAGTASATLGKQNGASAGYLDGTIYAIAWSPEMPPTAWQQSMYEYVSVRAVL